MGAPVAQLGTALVVSPPHRSQPLRLTTSTPLTEEDLGEAEGLGTEHAPSLSIWEKAPQPGGPY